MVKILGPTVSAELGAIWRLGRVADEGFVVVAAEQEGDPVAAAVWRSEVTAAGRRRIGSRDSASGMFDDEPVAKELVHLGQFEGIGQVRNVPPNA